MILCLGKFDALHRGHRALAEVAARRGDSALLRFTGMAGALGWEPRRPLVAEADRARIRGSWTGSPADVSLDFAEVRPLDAPGFLALVRQRFQATGLVVGDDFRGGRNRGSTARDFAAAASGLGMSVDIVAAVSDASGPISSTRVRAALSDGDVATVTSLLARPHRLLGTVVHGDGRGAAIGIPTANIGERQNQEPGVGVYAAWAVLDGQRLPAAVNIGRVPTAGPDRPLTVEAHLIGWQGTCYGRELGLDFVARLRPERRFPDFAGLVAQIRSDVAAATALLDDASSQ